MREFTKEEIQKIKEVLEPFDSEKDLEEIVEDSYPQFVKIGWLEVETVQILKKMDKVQWKMALRDRENDLVNDNYIVYVGDNYYYTRKVKDLLGE